MHLDALTWEEAVADPREQRAADLEGVLGSRPRRFESCILRRSNQATPGSLSRAARRFVVSAPLASRGLRDPPSVCLGHSCAALSAHRNVKCLRCCGFLRLYAESRTGLTAGRYSGRASLTSTSPAPVEKGQQWHENRSDLGLALASDFSVRYWCRDDPRTDRDRPGPGRYTSGALLIAGPRSLGKV